ncbi:histidine utilization repressor [Candidatus Sororendozoicomonas aggregata]|uniref:histidine utilization repressor n=1 Tax=Candidatus Sororendozoicomonas aggregata TaxID=3073239 RepID=UPI002ED41E68
MPAPLYLQIKHYITQKIDSGQWPEGHKITTELALTRQFNVSRMTANKAIRDLVAEGRLYRRPRRGTFVCKKEEKADASLLSVQNIAEQVRQRGKNYHCQIIRQVAIGADENVAADLEVRVGSSLFYSEIVHYENDSPVQLEMRWVNAEYVPEYISQDFSSITPNQYLCENSPLSAIEHTVEAIVPDTTVRLALAMSEQEACLLLKRRTWSNGKLVSAALFYHPGTRYKLSAKILME